MFDSFSRGFSVIWTVMAAAIATVGIVFLILAYRSRNQITEVEGTDTEIAIRTKQDGRVVKERIFPRNEVVDIRASVSGSTNGRSMKRVELIARGKAEPLFRWLDGDRADAFVEEVRRVL